MSERVCISSQWSIAVDPKAYAHQYDVEISFGRFENVEAAGEGSAKIPRAKVLTKSNNSYHKFLCRHILKTLGFHNDIAFVYDGRAILWASKALKNDINITMPQANLDDILRSSLPDRESLLHVVVTKAKSIKLDAFGQNSNGDVHENRTWRNVMELILTEDPITRSNNAFIAVGSGELFEAQSVPFDRGLVVRNGNKKGVHIIKVDNKPQLCISLDYTKKVFYPNDVTFLDLVRTFMAGGRDYAEAEALFRNIKLQPCYNRGRILTFKNFTENTVAQLTTDDNKPLKAYYANIKITLKHLNERAAIMSNGKGEFPLEILEVVPNQPVPVLRMPESLKEKTLELNRLKPHVRHRSILDQFAKLNFNNPVTNAFSIRVNQNMIEGSFEQLPPMSMVVSNNVILKYFDNVTFKFDKNKYYRAGQFTLFIVLATKEESFKSMECAKALVKAALIKGLQLPTPTFKEFNTSSSELADWVNALKIYEEPKAIVLTVDNIPTNHALLKLAEVITGVQTQHMFSETAIKATPTNVSRGRPITLENIVHKLNIKGGGLNHIVDFEKDMQKLKLDTTLIISVDVAHPTGDDYKGSTDEPSVVGIVGNYLKNPHEFAGTYAFQNPRQESVDATILSLVARQMLELVSKYRMIDTIVLLRDGVSEGQYAMVLDDELPAVKSASTDLSIKTSFLAIIVTKNGNARHFNFSSGHPESMPPRSFISFGIRHSFKQFYMTAHRAFAGTAKSVMITVIRDDLGLSKSEAQIFLLGLAHLHQIVTAPISLPAPIYQADILAERGQKLFRAFKKHDESCIPLVDGHIDYVKLTNMLNFNDGHLPQTRYTA